jgi:hypothetical protein
MRSRLACRKKKPIIGSSKTRPTKSATIARTLLSPPSSSNIVIAGRGMYPPQKP